MKTIRLNWGTGIAIFYLGFVAMIAALVIMSMREKVDLATEAYYAEELIFQQKIDKIKNANSLTPALTWQVNQEGIVITFPENMASNNISGHVMLYCPADNTRDKRFRISAAQYKMFIPKRLIAAGRYNLQIDWEYDQKKYWNEGVVVF